MTKLQKDVLDCVAAGMSGKEIAEKLNCSESSVKQTRADKNLQAVYEAQKEAAAKELEPYEIIKSTIPQMLTDMREIIKEPSANMQMKINAVKQMLEICELVKTVFPPKNDIKIEISYREPTPEQVALQEAQAREIAAIGGIQSGVVPWPRELADNDGM